MEKILDFVVTTYNDSTFLKEALLSIYRGATHPGAIGRVVVVDDASGSDHLAAAVRIVDELSVYYPNISLIRNSANCGLSHSRNLGIKHCTAPYIAFLDADDIKPVNWDELVIPALVAQKPDYLFTRSALIDDRYQYTQFYDETNAPGIFNGQSEVQLTGSSKFLSLLLEPQIGNKYIKRDLAAALQFPIGRKFEDLYLLARLVLKVGKVHGLNAVTHLYNITERAGRVTANPPLKFDILANLRAIGQIYDVHFESQLQAAKDAGTPLEAVKYEREIAFSSVKYAFMRMIDWSLRTIWEQDVPDYLDRAGKVLNSLPQTLPMGRMLVGSAPPDMLNWYDTLGNSLISKNAAHYYKAY